MIRPGARPRWQGWRGLCAAAILLCAARAAAGELAAGAPVADRAAADRLRQSVRADYVLQCAGCHRVDGRGSSRHGIPDFRNSVGAFVHLPEGREYLVRVPGAAQSQLSNAELAAVLNWVLEEFSPAQLPADFRPYTEQEVAQVRPRRYEDVVPVRHGLAQALSGLGFPLADYSYGSDRKP
ncbi:c-type cytochrome [Achromobacter anxifer]|jgi:mono/diheme cytochrome c family protein|uniref:c-type cytochrome n=1 Tax=Achromobacter anxifer TaxID=1287737 RepID=UPI00358F675C